MRVADGVELDARVDGQDALEPDAVVARVLAAEAPALDVPDARLSRRPVGLGSLPGGARRARQRPRRRALALADGARARPPGARPCSKSSSKGVFITSADGGERRRGCVRCFGGGAAGLPPVPRPARRRSRRGRSRSAATAAARSSVKHGDASRVRSTTRLPDVRPPAGNRPTAAWCAAPGFRGKRRPLQPCTRSCFAFRCRTRPLKLWWALAAVAAIAVVFARPRPAPRAIAAARSRPLVVAAAGGRRRLEVARRRRTRRRTSPSTRTA